MPDALVEELPFAKAVFFFDAGEADGGFYREAPADGFGVGLYLAADYFWSFVQKFNAEVECVRGEQLREQLECRLRLANA